MIETATQPVIKGSKYFKPGRRLNLLSDFRKCLQDDCPTILSGYNKGQKCWLHQPPKKVRTRGRPIDSPTRKLECSDCLRIAKHSLEDLTVLLDGMVHIQGDEGRATLCEG